MGVDHLTVGDGEALGAQRLQPLGDRLIGLRLQLGEAQLALDEGEAVAAVVALTDVRLVMGERLGLRTDDDAVFDAEVILEAADIATMERVRDAALAADWGGACFRSGRVAAALEAERAAHALGLARVWGAEVRGVSTLESLVRGDGPQAVSLDARKGNVYSAVYEVSGGTVTSTVQPVARRPLAEFEAELAEMDDDDMAHEMLAEMGITERMTMSICLPKPVPYSAAQGRMSGR